MKKQIKKIVSLILAAAVLFSVAAIGMSASAISADISVSENFYTTDGITGFNYTITDGEVEIGEIIPMGDFIIPESIDGYPVTAVNSGRNNFFYDSVYIPASVESFSEVNTRKYIVDENNPNYSSDEHGVLFDKNKETLISYPNLNTAKEYKIPNTVKYINEDAFLEAVYIENVVLNEGLIGIGWDAFSGSTIKTVNIPSTVEFMTYRSFYCCYNLESINVDENNSYYSNDEYGVLFNKDKTQLIKYPSGNTAEKYVIPDTVTSVSFGEGDYSLRAFDTSKYLKEITIPASLEKIIFYDFDYIEKVNISPDHPKYKSIDGVIYNKDGTEIVRYPRSNKMTCFMVPEEVTKAEWYGGSEYLATIVFNDYISENVVPIEDGEELSSYNHEILSDVYYMGEGEYFERTASNPYYNGTVTFHYNCKPNDHFHDYEIEVTTAPTCGKDGAATLTCSCGKVVTKELESTNMHMIADDCSEYLDKICCKSITYYRIMCKECGQRGVFKLKEIPEISMTTTYTPPTETEEGIHRNLCTECGERIGYGYIGIGNKTITYRSNGIDLVRDFAPGETINVNYQPEKENAEFIGWADENGNIVELPETMPDKDVKYTAIFRNVQKAEGFDVTATFDDGCFDADVEFSVKEIDGESKLGDVYMEDGKYFYQIGFYNIKMLGENGETVQPNSGKTVTVKMRIPDEYKNKTEFVITHWFAEGGREKLSVSNKLAWIEEGYLCFTVSKFSEFAIHVPVSGTVEMASAPAKTSYYYKEELDLSGIKFVVAGEEGTLEEITDTSEMKVSGYDPNTVGEQTVTVECRGVTEEFKVTVSYAWWQWIIRILLLGFLWY